VTYKPKGRPEGADSSPTAAPVDLPEFRRAALEMGFLDPEELERFVEAASGNVASLARSLVRAGKLTAYQAGALAQGKARGLVIEDYLILEKRGRGGMGVVFKARHRPSGRVVALKILPPSFGRDREAVLRFQREFAVAARLSHPNVVAALHAAEDRGVQFLTMEYIEGYDLDDLVSTVGPLPIKLALHCAIQAAHGLEAAHAQGIVHRDVKPGNLILDHTETVRVLDLGLARVIEAANPFSQPARGATTQPYCFGLTQTGMYMGTVDYMAPEQADDAKQADHRADIYSLGCTLYFLLTGHPPFGGDTVLKRLVAHQERPAPSLHAARDDVPAALEAAYQTMMAKRPGNRPRSMTEVVALLEGCRTSADEVKEARADLRRFAETVMKRAAPRRRDQERDPSVFARRTEPEFPHFNPDLDLEDLVMDFRPEPHLEPLPEEKLPPKPPRFAEPREPAQRRPPLRALGVLALMVLGVAGLLLLSLFGHGRVADRKADRPGPRVEAAYKEVTSGPAVVQAAKAAEPPEPTRQVSEPVIVQANPPASSKPESEVMQENSPEDKEKPKPESELKEDVATTVTKTQDPVTTTATVPAPEKKRTASILRKKKKPPVYSYPKRLSVDEAILRVGALQAWFGQDKEFADTCRRALDFAKGTSDPTTAERMAKVCCLRPTQDKTRLESALALARKGVDLGENHDWLPWFQMALGMAQYRNGHFAEAEVALIAAATGGKDNPHVVGTSAFYRAMSLFRQGKEKEALQLTIGAASEMKPLPKDEENPLTDNAGHDDLIVWMAYKEARALILPEPAPAAPAQPSRKKPPKGAAVNSQGRQPMEEKRANKNNI
jgi:serine/threonine protein kinase